jgi:hypothetical protein
MIAPGPVPGLGRGEGSGKRLGGGAVRCVASPVSLLTHERFRPVTDYYTSTSFGIDITLAEAGLLEEALGIIKDLTDGFETAGDELARYQVCSEAFRQAFPCDGTSQPFDTFRHIFADPDYPSAPAVFVPTAQDQESVHYSVMGDNIEPDALAELLRRTCPSILPLRFGFARTASRPRYGAFGGGYYEVRADRVVPLAYSDEGVDRTYLVIAMKDPKEGLLFWNNADGFGDLASARIFSEVQAEDYDLPIAGEQPEWMALPLRSAWWAETP